MTETVATQRVVAQLASSFPTAKIGADTLKMYVRALVDLPIGELSAVAGAWARDGQWFPSIRELRRGVVEARLELPTAEEAWAQAERLAFTQPVFEPCPWCESTGIADADLDTDTPCPECGGSGDHETARRTIRAGMTVPVQAAYEFVGGGKRIAGSDKLEVVRAQFLKAYQRERDQLVRTVSLESAGMGELAPAIRAIETART